MYLIHYLFQHSYGYKLEKIILKLCNHHKALITIEEGSIGSFGSHVLNFIINNKSNIYKKIIIETIELPDYFIEPDTPENMYAKCSKLSK